MTDQCSGTTWSPRTDGGDMRYPIACNGGCEGEYANQEDWALDHDVPVRNERADILDDRPPQHYSTESGMQPFDVIDAFGLDYYEGSALKYLLRWRQKGQPLSDLRKCEHYIREIIKRHQTATNEA